MKALITGSEGFLGRHFKKKLTSIGWEVTGIDRIKGMSCEDFFESNNEVFDYVFHLACYVDPNKDLKNVKKTNFSYDLLLDSSIFSWLIKTKQKNFVYFSSSAVYPVVLQNKYGYKLKESDMNIDSDFIRKPDNIYGWTKLTGEYMINFLKQNGINTYVFRPFSIFGEDQNNTFIFKTFLDMIEKKEEKFYIWGDGRQTRDFIYIEDVVNCVLSSLKMNSETPLNIGRGIAISINELLEIMLDSSGYKPKEIIHLLEKDGGPIYRCADISNMSEIYTPKYTIENVVKKYFNRKEQ